MINLSHSSKAGVIAFALLLASSLLVGSCEENRACTAIGCASSGLTIQLYRGGDGGLTPDPLQIDFATLVGQNFMSFMTCTFSGELTCDSGRAHSVMGSQINLPESDINMFRATYSANGTQLSQETITPVYTKTEPNGPGCNACTFATVRATLPPP